MAKEESFCNRRNTIRDTADVAVPSTDCTVLSHLEKAKRMERSIFIPIPMKGDTSNCFNYCTITLKLHISKTSLKIILQQLGKFIGMELPGVQAGFRKGRGTRDHIDNHRMIMGKYQKYVYMCFIDYTKAFDCVEHDKPWTALHCGWPGGTVWTAYDRAASYPRFFLPVIRKLDLDKSIIIVKIGGQNDNNLRYESPCSRKVPRIWNNWMTGWAWIRMSRQWSSWQQRATGNKVHVVIDGKKIESVQDYISLGSIITWKTDWN